MAHPARDKLLADMTRSEALRAEIMRRMDDEGYDLDAKWHEIERLDLDIHRQIRVLMMERQKRA